MQTAETAAMMAESVIEDARAYVATAEGQEVIGTVRDLREESVAVSFVEGGKPLPGVGDRIAVRLCTVAQGAKYAAEFQVVMRRVGRTGRTLTLIPGDAAAYSAEFLVPYREGVLRRTTARHVPDPAKSPKAEVVAADGATFPAVLKDLGVGGVRVRLDGGEETVLRGVERGKIQLTFPGAVMPVAFDVEVRSAALAEGCIEYGLKLIFSKPDSVEETALREFLEPVGASPKAT